MNVIISYLIEMGTRICSYAGKNLKIYNIGYWNIASEIKY